MEKKRRRYKKVLVLALVMAVFLMPITIVRASVKADAESMLRVYKKRDFPKVKKYCEKLMKKVGKDYSKKLSPKEKKAYRKIVKSFQLEGESIEEALWGYFLADLDGDKKAELLVRYGATEGDVRTAIYTCKRGKVKRIDEILSGHTYYSVYPGHKGIISIWGYMGYEGVATLSVEKGKAVIKSYGEGEIGVDYENPMHRLDLDDHVSYVENFKKILDLRELE